MFKKIEGYALEFTQFGSGGPGTIIVFRSPNPADVWQKPDAGTILIIGGQPTIREMKRLWNDLSRPKMQELFPISSSTHTKIKTYLAQTP